MKSTSRESIPGRACNEQRPTAMAATMTTEWESLRWWLRPQGQNAASLPNLSAIRFTSAQVGWAVGDKGTILHTEDGGGNWLKQDSGSTNDLRSVFFADAQLGWAVGDKGAILHSE